MLIAAMGASAQVVNTGEPYRVAFFGNHSGPWINAPLTFDGIAESASGQPANFFSQPVGSPVTYNFNESTINNNDGTWTIRVEVWSDEPDGFLAPGLNFGLFGDTSITTQLTFDLGATTFGTNDGIRTTSNDVTLVSADISWFAGSQLYQQNDAYSRIALSLGGQLNNLATGTGLRGQFNVSTTTGDIGAIGLDRLVLDMVVVPAPSVPAVIALSSLAIAARRRRS